MSTEIRFDDRVAIVTGAGGGLGRAYALALARRGAKVVVNDLGGAPDGTGGSSRAADLVVEEIKKRDGQAVASYDSVSDAKGGQAVVDRAVEAFGRVDILINNAGILRDKTFHKMEWADFETVLKVHLYGAYNVTRPALAKMRENNYGRIVLTTSAAGLFGNFGQTNYSAAKLGIVGFMNTLKLEGAKYNINVNTVAPIAATRLTEGLFPPDIGKKLKPEFIAPLVLFLCSEDCQVTGHIYDAGMGGFRRTGIVTGPTVVLSKGDVPEGTPPLPEEVKNRIADITSLDGAQEFENATSLFGAVLEAFSRAGSAAAEPSAAGLSVAGVFEHMPKHFQADKAAGVDVVFQYCIAGEGGGDWQVAIQDGKCAVQAGKHGSPTTTIKMSEQDFLDLMGGKLQAMQAYTSGKLKIEGDMMKSQLIEKLFKFK
jgi:NAD(P)-dependent dehydrogenase (short-subunit alcohol dehydrogenase family)/putative sterol carrier protein